MITGRNKGEFIEYLVDKFSKHFESTTINDFLSQPIEAQIGFYLAYYESIGFIFEVRQVDGFVYIWDYRKGEPEKAIHVDCQYLDDSGFKDYCKEAFKKADELVNERR